MLLNNTQEQAHIPSTSSPIIKSITLSADKSRIEIRFPYSEGMVNKVKTLFGRQWDKDNRCWYFPAKTIFANVVLKFGREFMFEIDSKVMALGKETVSSVKKLDRSPLYLHQPTAVDFIHSRNGTCILADDMGVGKTIEALWYVKEQPLIKKILIVSPASVLYKWKAEVSKWLERDSEVIRKGSQEFPANDIWIVSYSLMPNIVNRMVEMDFDLLILDECHYVSSPKAKRSNAVRLIKSERTLFLSGTPFLNRPIELWNILSMINPGEWGSYWKFAARYCDSQVIRRFGKQFVDVSGSSNLEELSARLQNIMIRRTRHEVLKDLPELTRTFLPIELNSYSEYNKAIADLKQWLRDNKGEDRRLTALTKLGYLRYLVGISKVPMAVEVVQDLLNADVNRKVVVYAHHRDVVDKLKEALAEFGCETIVGDDNPLQRSETNRRFQDKELPRVLVISSAGGEGIDLYRADSIVFVEREWNPSKEEQAEGRLHRIGQVNPVSAYYLVAKRTIDEHIDYLISQKRGIIGAILNIENEILDYVEKGV